MMANERKKIALLEKRQEQEIRQMMESERMIEEIQKRN